MTADLAVGFVKSFKWRVLIIISRGDNILYKQNNQAVKSVERVGLDREGWNLGPELTALWGQSVWLGEKMKSVFCCLRLLVFLVTWLNSFTIFLLCFADDCCEMLQSENKLLYLKQRVYLVFEQCNTYWYSKWCCVSEAMLHLSFSSPSFTTFLEHSFFNHFN